jgi:hypothetical protein
MPIGCDMFHDLKVVLGVAERRSIGRGGTKKEGCDGSERCWVLLSGSGSWATVAMRDILYKDRRANGSCLEGAMADGQLEIESVQRQTVQNMEGATSLTKMHL